MLNGIQHLCQAFARGTCATDGVARIAGTAFSAGASATILGKDF